MELLISKNTVEIHLQTAIGYKSSDFDKFIREAQEFDLKELFCEDFYNDLLST